MSNMSQGLLRTIATDKLSEAQPSLASRWWEKLHQTQSCSNLSRCARCLPVAASVRLFNSHTAFNRSPFFLDNQICSTVGGMTAL